MTEQKHDDAGGASLSDAGLGARAIEFAEYMAKDAEHLMDAMNALAVLYMDDDPDRDADTGDIEDAEQTVSEAVRGLRSAIYEFRKRADKATPNDGGQQTPACGRSAAPQGCAAT